MVMAYVGVKRPPPQVPFIVCHAHALWCSFQCLAEPEAPPGDQKSSPSGSCVCNAARITLFSQIAVDDLDRSKLAGSESQPLTRGCQLEATTVVRAITNNPDLKMGGPLNSRSLEQSNSTYTRGGLSGPGAPNGSCEQKDD